MTNQKLLKTLCAITLFFFIQAVQASIMASAVQAQSHEEGRINTNLKTNLEQQYKQLRTAIETTEDAFSLVLAENYFGYGALLQEAGRLEEARKAFTNALHIEKVNHGLYSLEQRPTLKALFNTHYDLGNIQEFEDYLTRILLIEKHHPEVDDGFSFEMLLQVGHYYLREFRQRPTIASELNLSRLKKSNYYFGLAVIKNNKSASDELLLPYGELALSHFYESGIIDGVTTASSYQKQRSEQVLLYGGQFVQPLRPQSIDNGLTYLKASLIGAETDNNIGKIILSYLDFADYYFLLERNADASKYYKLAWSKAQTLADDNLLRLSLSQPVKLPAFNYAMALLPVTDKKPVFMMPMVFSVSKHGLVMNVQTVAKEDENFIYYRSAKQQLSRMLFRPAIIDGEMVDSQQLNQPVKVTAKKTKPKAEIKH